MATELRSPQVVIIRPTRGWLPVRIRELWAHRELLYFLVWRDLKIRYKQTILGVGWAVIQPVFLMLIFTFIFGNLARLPSEGVPYPVFVYVALLPWNLFAKGLTEGSTSLVMNERLITRVYLPRLILPAAPVTAGLVDFAIAFVVLIGLMFYFGIVPTLAVLLLPLFIVIAFITALGISMWLSAIDARYRDVRYTLPFLTQFWFFATPIVYSASLLPSSWRWLYSLNPMVSVIEGFRWALLGTPIVLDLSFVISLGIIFLLFVGGLFYFRRSERIFADVV